MLLKLVLPLLILAGTLPIARADDASKLAKVHEIFGLMNARQVASRRAKLAAAEFDSDMSKQFAKQDLTADEKLKLKRVYGKLNQLIESAYSWDRIEPQYAKIYADAFTERQLDQIISVYKTPIGKEVSEKRPIIMEQLGQAMHQQWLAVSPEIHQTIMDFEKQIKAERQKSTPKR
jgi:hypothetical protein